MPEEDYWYLCFNCGFITEFEKWEMLKWDEEHLNLIPSPEGEDDPICRCPVCKWDHIDDDSNPGIMDGTHGSLCVERERAKDGWQDLWAETAEEVFGL